MGKKTVIVTGGARSIGANIAITLAEEGYDIVISDIMPEENAVETINLCKEKGAKVLFLQSDVSKTDSCEGTVKKVLDNFGGIYGLINNAGINRDALLIKMTEEQYDAVLNVNLKSVFNMSKAVTSAMLKAREGRIVNISSIVGLFGNAGQTNYSAAKAGMIGFTKSLAKEIGSRGITVNAIAPGYIKTNMTDALDDKSKTELTSRIALRRLGTSQDIADVVSFLVSEKASYITAQVISVDGGMSI